MTNEHHDGHQDQYWEPIASMKQFVVGFDGLVGTNPQNVNPQSKLAARISMNTEDGVKGPHEP